MPSGRTSGVASGVTFVSQKRSMTSSPEQAFLRHHIAINQNQRRFSSLSTHPVCNPSLVPIAAEEKMVRDWKPPVGTLVPSSSSAQQLYC
jgi:hypothetical protein